MPPPRWVQECDHYLLKWLVSDLFTWLMRNVLKYKAVPQCVPCCQGKSISAGSITGGPSTADESPDIPDEWLSEEEEFELIDDKPLFSKRRRKRDLEGTAELVLDKITSKSIKG